MGQWQSQPLCNTPACVHAAANILQNLHPQWDTMDPCTEFGEMLCYGFKQHNAVNFESLTAVNQGNKRLLQSILESPDHATAAGIRSTHLGTRGLNDDEHNFDILRTAYQACMNVGAAAAEGIQPLTDFLASVNETWPVTDFTTKVGSDYDGLLQAVLKVEELGIPVLQAHCQGEVVLPDPSDPKVNHACISLPSVEKRNFTLYTDPAKIEELVENFTVVFQLLYPTLDEEAVAELSKVVAAFEADLGKLLLEYEGQHNPEDVTPTLERVSLAKASASAPALNLEKLITALTGKKPATVLLDVPSFWPKFSEIITKHPKAAIMGFMARKAAQAMTPYLESPELRQIYGVTPGAERGLDCVDAVRTMADDLLDSYYIKAAYNDDSKRVVGDMATNIIATFKKRVGELEWIGKESRDRAVNKVSNIIQNIGYETDKTIQPDLTSAESLATYYRDLNITGSHFSNALAGKRHSTAKSYAQAEMPFARTAFLRSVGVTNALYYMMANSVEIPAGVSQLPLFHHQLPDYALYGGLGSIIGHEVTHGFDSNGRKWNEHAVFAKWWDDESISNFEDRSQCFVEQFNAFQVDVPGGKANISGERTLAENISDAGGLRSAYDAWVAERKAKPSAWDQDLPGLDKFTHEQLFYMFWGNNWCNAYSPEMMQASVAAGAHAPASARLALTAQNSRGFKEAFKCKAKEPVCEIF